MMFDSWEDPRAPAADADAAAAAAPSLLSEEVSTQEKINFKENHVEGSSSDHISTGGVIETFLGSSRKSVMASIVVLLMIGRLIKTRISNSRHGRGGRYHFPWRNRRSWRGRLRIGSEEDEDDDFDLEMTSMMADTDFEL